MYKVSFLVSSRGSVADPDDVVEQRLHLARGRRHFQCHAYVLLEHGTWEVAQLVQDELS